MSSLPTAVSIHEVGPREGFQFEKGPIPTERKVELVDALSKTGLRRIQVTSFVSPKWLIIPTLGHRGGTVGRAHGRRAAG